MTQRALRRSRNHVNNKCNRSKLWGIKTTLRERSRFRTSQHLKRSESKRSIDVKVWPKNKRWMRSAEVTRTAGRVSSRRPNLMGEKEETLWGSLREKGKQIIIESSLKTQDLFALFPTRREAKFWNAHSYRIGATSPLFASSVTWDPNPAGQWSSNNAFSRFPTIRELQLLRLLLLRYCSVGEHFHASQTKPR